MNRWRDWDEYRATKRAAPEHGIKVKKAGTTWWGQRWIEALQHVLQGDARRLERGRSYARSGRVHDLEVSVGKVLAQVTGTRPTPYQVELVLTPLSDQVWRSAIAAMAAQAQFSAELLAGEMPRAIDEAFSTTGSTLFPERRSELTTRCSCPDSGDPCKHVAATHYVLGDAFDRDPFLLFELRGRVRARVLSELRQARTGAAEPPPAAEEDSGADVPTVLLSPEELTEYERPRAALPVLSFSFDAPSSDAGVLRQLGLPEGWSVEGSPAEAFAPSLRRAAEAARRMALGEPEHGQPSLASEASEAESPPAPPPESPARPRRRTRVTESEPAPERRPSPRKKSRRPSRS